MSTPIYNQLAQERGDPFSDSRIFKMTRMQLSVLWTVQLCQGIMIGTRPGWEHLERRIELVDSMFYRCLMKWDWHKDRRMHMAIRIWAGDHCRRTVAKAIKESGGLSLSAALYHRDASPAAWRQGLYPMLPPTLWDPRKINVSGSVS